MYIGAMDSRDLKQLGLEKLKGKWGIAILATLIFMLISSTVIQDFIRSYEQIYVNLFSFPDYFNDFYILNLSRGSSLAINITKLVLTGPMLFGLSKFFLKLSRGEDVKIGDLFCAFTDGGLFIKTFILYLVMDIFILLWTLLLIVPGIIATIKYSMAFYILCDNPQLSSLEAIDLSKEMMEGNKSRLFTLWITFIGWFILEILSLGILSIFIDPYYNAAKVEFYQELKGMEAV
ncbi:DUF975 family protein [Haloimpatiens sp. FM7330]|uniref:DUF975 family protein n=1 Tax=Haloimpatiens sp. FM7330 TaxID=3298610 RepID=UPI00363A049F